ncbi:MAG: hypothetical protein VX589_17900 [Myxococcota bacterium]|nr:hypothetical protein [Myxococcota bacterium]
MNTLQLSLWLALIMAAPFLVQCTPSSDDGDDGDSSYSNPSQAPGLNENTPYQSSCSYDSDCEDNETDTMCGSDCGQSPSCREPGELGTPCESNYDCRAASDTRNSMSERRCILGVCEDITYRGIVYGPEHCSLNGEIALETDDGELTNPFTGCVIADRGTYIEVLLITAGTTGNFREPGEGWLSLSLPYHNLLGSDLRLFFANPPELQDGQIGDVDAGDYWSVPNDFGVSGSTETSVITYYTDDDGTICLGDSGQLKVTNFAEEYFRSVCSEDQQGDDGQGRLSLNFEFRDLTCTSQSLYKQSARDGQTKRFSGTVALNGKRGSRGQRSALGPGGSSDPPPMAGSPLTLPMAGEPMTLPNNEGGECTADGVFDCGNDLLCKALPQPDGKFIVATMVQACGGCTVQNAFLSGERSKEIVCHWCTLEDRRSDTFTFEAYRDYVCTNRDSFYECSYSCICRGEGCN